jgi:predicted nucleic acid-binding protein
MKNIVLDTSILYQEGLASGRMKVLAKLVANELITVYVPEIVKREFITKRISEITEAITNIQSNLKTILRKVDRVGSFKDQSKVLPIVKTKIS